MNNLPPFYIGQKVVFIGNSFLPKNSTWIVKNIIKFNCGCWAIDIGIEYNNTYQCYEHKSNIIPSSKRLISTKLFRALEEKPFESIQYSKVIEKEKIGVN